MLFIAMRNRLNEREEGFTLIELLVVVIIIGILAAIAIPTFLSQRERGYQAEITSAVRNAALDLEAEATSNNGVYLATADGETAVDAFIANELGNPDANGDGTVDLTITYTQGAGGTSFTLCGQTQRIATAHSQPYDSSTGGLQPFDNATAC